LLLTVLIKVCKIDILLNVQQSVYIHCGPKKTPVRMIVVCTNVDWFLYNLHTVYWVNLQHNSYWFSHLTYVLLLHYLEKH